MNKLMFENWSTNLNCSQCDKSLNLLQQADNPVSICPSCKKKYTLVQTNDSLAFADSDHQDFYRFTPDSSIEVRCFINYPFQELEEAWQDFCNQGLRERPVELLPIIKKYHDAIKMRLRRLMEVRPGSLTADDITVVKQDPLGSNLNILNLFEYLKKAYPEEEEKIQDFYDENQDMLMRIKWVRNKLEHLNFTQWPLHSNIFSDLNKNPSDQSGAEDSLNLAFVEKVNTLAVDIFQLASAFLPTDPNFLYINIGLYRKKILFSKRRW